MEDEVVVADRRNRNEPDLGAASRNGFAVLAMTPEDPCVVLIDGDTIGKRLCIAQLV